MSTENYPSVRQTIPIKVDDLMVDVEFRALPLPLPLPSPAVQSWELGVDITKEEFSQRVTLYQAGLTGDWETVKRIWTVSPTWLSTRITKGGETVLHIAAAAKHTRLVKALVYVMDCGSLTLANKLGNTALCFAAVSGVVEIAQTMVEKNRDLPNIRGSQGMTPLHMAVLLGHVHMVEYLLKVTDDAQLTDEDRIGLLTSSIDTDMFEVASNILHKHPHLSVLRDAKKETALHALARKPLKHGANHLSLWQKYKLQWKGKGVSDQDQSREPKVALELVQRLWNEVVKHEDEDISHLIGYPWRLLFVAAKLGKVEFLTVLIRSYPDLIWKVDENRCSIFHIAIIHRHEEIFNLIYEIGAIKDLIATYKDDHGNNMLHLASKLAPHNRLNTVYGAALQMQREILWFKAVERIVRPEYTEAENKDRKTPHDLFSEEHEGLRAKGEEWMKKTAESCALVAALIATVAFSAAFQLPGGVNTQGSPNLLSKPYFVAFAMSNAISLFTSTASILMFLSILTSRYAENDFLRSLPSKLMMGLILLLFSMVTMILSFTATFVISFQDGMKWVPIPIGLIAFFPITLFASQQFRLLVDIYQSTYKSRSIFCSNKSNLFQVPQHHPILSNVLRNCPTFTAYNPSIFVSNHGEASSRHPSSCCPTASKLSRFSTLHRPTASRIVDPSPSEQCTPTFRDNEEM
ncbi:hypothetical protein RND81_10G015700 [Saponaria officinalis]|uniref:PGG domain-containing protein n=1 Tax=Saponaria officinalis TaxID=3572 RepID=A0AAW1HX40_SAPOF